MADSLKIGITGGIGSGKSIISKVFATLSVPIYNSDDRGKYLTKTNEVIKNGIKDTFGVNFFDEMGNLLSQKLGGLVFNDKAALAKLNAIVHPVVAQDFENWLDKQNSPYVLKESAIIFENNIHKNLDAVILVTSPLPLRIKNIQKRDPFRSIENIMAVINNQMSDAEKEALAQYVINNDENSLVIDQVLNIHKKILEKCSQTTSNL
jgi:dephospho-CoA kinase